MTAAGMAAAIQTEVQAEFTETLLNAEQLEKFCLAVGTAVVGYIQASALVNGTVESGEGAGGSVTGTVS
jgi:hypothetical protein